MLKGRGKKYRSFLTRVGDSVLGNIKMKLHLPDPPTSLPFSRGERKLYVKDGRTPGSVGFMGVGFRDLLYLAAGRLRIKLYMKYLSP